LIGHQSEHRETDRRPLIVILPHRPSQISLCYSDLGVDATPRGCSTWMARGARFVIGATQSSEPQRVVQKAEFSDVSQTTGPQLFAELYRHRCRRQSGSWRNTYRERSHKHFDAAEIIRFNALICLSIVLRDSAPRGHPSPCQMEVIHLQQECRRLRGKLNRARRHQERLYDILFQNVADQALPHVDTRVHLAQRVPVP